MDDNDGRVIPVLIGSTQVGTARIFDEGTDNQTCVVSLDVELIGYTLDQNAEGKIVAMLLGPDFEEVDDAESYFIVERDFLHGWADAGWEKDGFPLRFSSREDAVKAIKAHCQALDCGSEEYRVVEIVDFVS